VFFSVKDRDQALGVYDKFQKGVYDKFHKNAVTVPAARSKLYYIRPEEVFVKFGDSEAAK